SSKDRKTVRKSLHQCNPIVIDVTAEYTFQPPAIFIKEVPRYPSPNHVLKDRKSNSDTPIYYSAQPAHLVHRRITNELDKM
ncbi:MAG: hypothetical protein Q9193_000680, partial [Seirophora villosa]